MRKLAVVVSTMASMGSLAGVGSVGLLAGCYDDPDDPKMYIKQLDDPREQKNAVRQLVKLQEKGKDPGHTALAPLTVLYKKSHEPEHLKAIAAYNDPVSVPVLVDSLDYSEDSFDNASIAATALGNIGEKSAVDSLIKAVLKPLPIKTRANIVKLESMKSLAKMKDPRAVDALIKVLSTAADEQDFFLNQVAAKSLGEFADSKAVPALVRGLFMVGRGANIFQECRAAIVTIGEPALPKVIESMQHKNAELEADGKKYEFVPGIIVQKTAMLLGDLHSAKAVPALLEQLAKKDDGAAAGEGKGVSEHQAVLTALGLIGDKSNVKQLVAIVDNAKSPNKERIAAAEALNLLGDPSALPSLLNLANSKFLNKSEIDPEAAMLAATGAVNFGRLAQPDTAYKFQAIPPPSDEDYFADVRIQFQAGEERVAVAKECKADAACYDKYLSDKSGNKAEKAAFMLSRMGKPGLGPLCKHLNTLDAQARMAILFGVGHLADKSATECITALTDQIKADEGKPQPYRSLVQEMRVVKAQLTH